jgi:hypothetical protein
VARVVSKVEGRESQGERHVSLISKGALPNFFFGALAFSGPVYLLQRPFRDVIGALFLRRNPEYELGDQGLGNRAGVYRAAGGCEAQTGQSATYSECNIHCIASASRQDTSLYLQQR